MKVKNLSKIFGAIPTYILISIIKNKRKENYLVFDKSNDTFSFHVSEGKAVEVGKKWGGTVVNLRK